VGIAALALIVAAAPLYDHFLQGPGLRACRPNLVYLTKWQVCPSPSRTEETAADVVIDGSLEIAQDAKGFLV